MDKWDLQDKNKHKWCEKSEEKK